MQGPCLGLWAEVEPLCWLLAWTEMAGNREDLGWRGVFRDLSIPSLCALCSNALGYGFVVVGTLPPIPFHVRVANWWQCGMASWYHDMVQPSLIMVTLTSPAPNSSSPCVPSQGLIEVHY